MTLSRPHRLVAGACTCSPDACACAPADLAERMTTLTETKVRADAARDAGNHDEEQRLRTEQSSHAAQLRAALAPQPRKEVAMNTTGNYTHSRRESLLSTGGWGDAFVDEANLEHERRVADRLRGSPPSPSAERTDARDRRADAWRNQWREPLTVSDRDREFLARPLPARRR